LKLVVAEKPSVAKEIAYVIGADNKNTGYFEGNGYIVSYAVGHLLQLAEAAAYNERIKHGLSVIYRFCRTLSV